MTPYLQQRVLYPPLIQKKPSLNLGIVVVIPAYREPYLLLSLMSLKRCSRSKGDVEVIVVINDSEKASASVKAENQKIYEQTVVWATKNSTPQLQFRIVYKDHLQHKFAGVGLARKIGMDEACYRFEKVGVKAGIIVCFDADSLCQPNYFLAIEAHFKRHPKIAACSIHFEHPLAGADHEPEIYEAIANYELHLRYFINAQKWAGAPYAYQTIGSAMAVRSNFYQQQGGMNRRKAGEDFYFLHKFIDLGKCNQLSTTTVIPSPRISDRVPFGTGKAVGLFVKDKEPYTTYNPAIFKDLKALFALVPELYQTENKYVELGLSDCMVQYLEAQNFAIKLTELRNNTANFSSFKKRFFHWFNAFQLMKFAHFARDHYYENVLIETAAAWLLTEYTPPVRDTKIVELLKAYRQIDR